MLSDRAISICLLQVLKEYSDENHVLGIRDVISLMTSQYDMRVDRRTIYSAVSLLKELGYDISDFSENGKGYYLRVRDFEISEVRLLMDSVYSLQSIPPKQTERLIKKLQQLVSIHERKNYRHLAIARPGHKTSNQSVFLNIELLDEAITQKKQVEFVYLAYGLDKQLHPRREEAYRVSPYQMVCEGGRYYLVCRMVGKPNISYYRIDLMQNIEVLQETVEPLPAGVTPRDLSNVPYAFTGEMKAVLLKAEHHTLGNLIDRFGTEIKIISHDEETYTARVQAPEKGMLFWALQYLPYVEVLEPASLREEIMTVLEKNRYR